MNLDVLMTAKISLFIFLTHCYFPRKKECIMDLSLSALTLVVGGLLNLLSLIEVPVVGLGGPGFGPELDHVRFGHRGVGFSVWV